MESDFTSGLDTGLVASIHAKLDDLVLHNNISEQGIESVVDKIGLLIKGAAMSCGSIKPRNKENKQNDVQRKASEPWFDANCVRERKEYRRAKNRFCRHSDNVNKQQYDIASKKYKKVVRKQHKIYLKRLNSELL